MKRLPIVSKETSETFAKDLGHDYWRTPEDRRGDLTFRAQQAREFVDGEHEPPNGMDRRTFMTFMGASMALAGLAGCRRPEEKILPYARMPEDLIPGRPTHYATSIAWAGSSIGLLVESHEGRPTKIEGNPSHPESLGATKAFHQAVVLDLYDPDRSTAPRQGGKDTTWAEADAALTTLATALRGKSGAGLAILVEDHRSLTTKRSLAALLRDLPQAKVFRWDPLGQDNAREGARLALGQPVEAVFDLEKADVVLSLDADFLGLEAGSVRHSKGWSRRRRVEDGPMSRVYVAESSPSETGFAADHRLRLQSRQIVLLGRAVASALGVDAGKAGAADPKLTAFAAAVAKDLQKAGAKGLVIAGRNQPKEVHALALAINDKLGAIGTTVRMAPAFDDVPSGAEALSELAKPAYDTVVILGGNPIFDAPADVDLAKSLKGKTTIHLSTHVNETSAACSWHLPRAHALESWSDTVAQDGTAAVVQPLIAPMYGGRTDAELVDRLLASNRTAYELVRATWAEITGAAANSAAFEAAWRRAVHDGVQPAAPASMGTLTVRTSEIAAAVESLKLADGAVEVTFGPDAHAWDGRFANSAWLQELPDAIHKLCWANAACVAPATAKKLGVASGDHVTVAVGGASVTLPAIITFGQADDSVRLTIGQGRKVVGRVGTGVGFDTTPLRRTGALDIAGGTLAKATGSSKLPITQGHFSLEGRPLVREQTAVDVPGPPGAPPSYKKDPSWAKHVVHHPPEINLFQGPEYHGHKWAMAIDLSLCTGCGTCVTACQAENNTPVTGPEGVLRNREMHWIRVDRYYEGSEEDPRSVTQPMTCQHCENAPCEQVCPVNATTHSPEGINEMTYNRCIGTKYCGNNCPYKVRRFNYFHYNADIPATTRMQLNPDVTVRSRGVMEKCSFCVQRINQAKIEAKVKDGSTRVKDGAVVTACQQACPTEAITFGDLNDGAGRVGVEVNRPRSYKILQELNVRPRLSYLARISNPNPELVKA